MEEKYTILEDAHKQQQTLIHELQVSTINDILINNVKKLSYTVRCQKAFVHCQVYVLLYF